MGAVDVGDKQLKGMGRGRFLYTFGLFFRFVLYPEATWGLSRPAWLLTSTSSTVLRSLLLLFFLPCPSFGVGEGRRRGRKEHEARAEQARAEGESDAPEEQVAEP